MYTINTVNSFLIGENLMDTDAILFGDFESTSINRRNHNIQVTTLNYGNFMIKQIGNLQSENAETLKREAQFYKCLGEMPNSFKRHVPEALIADPLRAVIVMRFYDKSTPLWKYYNERMIERFPMKTVSKIGQIIAEMQNVLSIPEVFQKNADLGFLEEKLPFIFNLYKPHPRVLSYLGKGGLEFIEHLQQQDDIMSAFNRISLVWEKNAVIHGDIKLDNFIVVDQEEEDSVNIKLVDWEMVQIGDHAWDVAGGFNDFIFWWVITMPDDVPPEEMVKNARFPIYELHPAINAFWNSYCENRGGAVNGNRQFVQKVMLFTGFRLLQTAYEIASKFDSIPHIARLILNMGKSVIRNPDLSMEKLFGLPQFTVNEPVIN